jgi:hypothetical protein
MSGGGGGPTSSTVTQSNIPDWLRPQVEATLGAGMQEMFQTQKGEDGTLQITGMKPFTPYSEDPSNYVAGFSPLQQQAFGNTANLQVPGQYRGATDMATQAGLGGLSTAGQAAGIAGMQAGAGNQYMQMATNPFATQAFMSPYMQNVVNVQQQQAQRQADIARQSDQARFAQSGAFGGSRQGIAGAQANADLMRQKQNIQASGLQSAFEQAQKAQQFGADLGLRGLTGAQQGMQNVLGAYDLVGRQGANLANIGSQQLGAQKDIIGLQAQMGGQQQQREQNIINQAIQNYSNAQENPLQRLSAFNSLLRGYAVPGQTTTSYQAAPPMASQLAGLGMGAYGASKLFAKGGKVEEPQRMATGGIPAINRKVFFDPDSVTLDQVKQGIKNQTLSDLIGRPVEMQKEQAKAMPGINALTSNLPEEMKGGGIVAFNGDEGSLVESKPQAEEQKAEPQTAAEKLGLTRPALGTTLADLRKALGTDRAPSPEVQAYLKAQRDAALSPDDMEKQKGFRLLQAGLGIMGGRSPNALQNIAEGAQTALKGYEEDLSKQKAAGIASLKAQADVAEAQRKERTGEVMKAADMLAKERDDYIKAMVSKAPHISMQSAQNYVKMMRDKGDARPDAELVDEGLKLWAYRQGAAYERVGAMMGATASGAQTAAGSQNLQADQLRIEARGKALDAWGKLKISSPDLMAYRRMMKAEGKEAADAFKEEWINKNIQTRLQDASLIGRQPPGQPAPGRPAPGNAPAVAPPQGAIDLLKKDPSLKSKFEAKYGPGSADQYLK